MGNKTFTEKVVDLLLNGDMPSTKGQSATESGLIIVTSKMTTPVCASYGSSLDMAVTISHILELNTPIRAVLVAAVGAYAKSHPDDPYIADFKQLFK